MFGLKSLSATQHHIQCSLEVVVADLEVKNEADFVGVQGPGEHALFDPGFAAFDSVGHVDVNHVGLDTLEVELPARVVQGVGEAFGSSEGALEH
jgi:hypothetical protein